MRQPKNLAEARQIFSAEKSKFAAAASAIAGSRWLMAVLATFALAFGTHLAYAPDRLPPVTGLSAADFGLPTNLDFGVAGEQAEQAAAAARNQDMRGHVADAIAANPDRAPLINTIGFGLAMALLAINMIIMTKRRRHSRG